MFYLYETKQKSADNRNRHSPITDFIINIPITLMVYLTCLVFLCQCFIRFHWITCGDLAL